MVLVTRTNKYTYMKPMYGRGFLDKLKSINLSGFKDLALGSGRRVSSAIMNGLQRAIAVLLNRGNPTVPMPAPSAPPYIPDSTMGGSGSISDNSKMILDMLLKKNSFAKTPLAKKRGFSGKGVMIV